MSAPLKLNSKQLSNIATALHHLTNATKWTGVRFDAYGPLHLELDGNNLDVRLTTLEDGNTEYVIDDQVGS